MKRVSVVIPTHDRADHLPRAVESALKQTHSRVEVVVVDDGSTDQTPRILAEMSQGEPRLRVVRHQESRGAPSARNAGVGAARGEIVAFLDDDCTYHPDKIRRQLLALSPRKGVVYCQQIIQQIGGGWEVEGAPGAGERPLAGLLSIGTNAILLPRALFLKVGGFDEGLPRLQDWELLLRLSRETGFAFVPEILVQGVMVKGGITLTPGPLKKAAERIVEKHAPFLSRRERSLLLFILGKFLLVDGLTAEARRSMVSALKKDPLSLRAWAGLGAALLGPGPARYLRDLRRDKRTADSVEGWGMTSAAPRPEPTDRP